MPEWPANMPRNTFKQALANGQRQVGLWSGLASPDRGGDRCRRGLRLDRYRWRARAERYFNAADAIAGHARRHRRAGIPRALERHGHHQTCHGRGRAHAAGSVCAER